MGTETIGQPGDKVDAVHTNHQSIAPGVNY